MKKIGIIGSGPVGQTLASGFIKHGFIVKLGSRDVSKLESWKNQAGKNGSIGSFEEAAIFGEIIVLTVKGSAASEAIQIAGTDNFSGKTVIDTTNPIGDTAPINGVLNFFSSINKSLMEDLQMLIPQAHLVKAFSCIGSPFMVNPQFKEGKPTMFICGNNERAKTEVSNIVSLFGFDVEDMGMVEAARSIEPLCILWCIPGLRDNNWNHAFKLLKG